MFFGTLHKKLGLLDNRQSSQRLGGAPRQCRYDGSRLRIESLEDRRMLSVSPLLAAIHSSASSAASTPPAITLHVQPGTSYYGRSVLMTAKVPGATGGTVEFLDGTTLLDTATPLTDEVFNYTTSTLTVGSHPITAEYFATGATSPTDISDIVTEQVNATPTHTVVTASANPVVLTGSSTTADVTLTAAVGSGSRFRGTSGPGNVPVGTVTFTVTDTAGGPGATTTDTETLDSTGKASYTPSLAAGSYDVTVTFNPGNGNYATSATPKPLVEQVVTPSVLGSGTVSTGGTSATLHGGQQVTIDVAQDNSSGLTETGNGITYVDTAKGIDLTSTQVEWVVFSSNGHRAEIVGTGTNTNADGSTTPVTFTMLVNGGNGNEYSRPSVTMIISGGDINYHRSSAVSQGSVSVDGTGDITIPRLSSAAHGRALQAVLDDRLDLPPFEFLNRYRG